MFTRSSIPIQREAQSANSRLNPTEPCGTLYQSSVLWTESPRSSLARCVRSAVLKDTRRGRDAGVRRAVYLMLVSFDTMPEGIDCRVVLP